MNGLVQGAVAIGARGAMTLVALLLAEATLATALAEVSEESCNQTVSVMENLTKQQVEQMAAAPASARVVQDCYTKFASGSGSGEACLKRECVAVLEEGIPERQGKTIEVSVEDCLSAAEDLIVINKTIELNYLNFMKACRNAQAAQ